MYKKKTKKKSSFLSVLIATIILLGLAGAALYLTRDSSQPSPEQPVNTINFGPPTEEEQAAGDEKKEELVAEEESPPELPDEASVAIVDASQYGNEIEVRAFISNVVQNGRCIITFENAGESLTKTVDAFADATTTPCINLVVPRDEFTNTGEWTVTVEYRNDTIKGSATSTLNIE